MSHPRRCCKRLHDTRGARASTTRRVLDTSPRRRVQTFATRTEMPDCRPSRANGAARVGRHRSHGLRTRRRACSRPGSTSPSTTARAPRPSRWPSSGADVVDTPAELADRDIVFTMVAGPDDFKEVVLGDERTAVETRRGSGGDRRLVDGLARRVGRGPGSRPSERGVALLAAPVSGNPKVVDAGQADGRRLRPARRVGGARARYLELLGAGVTYVGEGERARLVKICHNLMLGVVAQSLAEITVLAEKGGVSRAAFLEFLNNSVMGSMFTRYKTPAIVNLDFTPTFTPALLLQGLPTSGFEAAERARRADAGGGGRAAGRAGADGLRLRRRGLHGAARASRRAARRSSSSPRTCR